jgi:UDP-N-acetylglucosamine:LPS N-acetylglucosamine transferase
VNDVLSTPRGRARILLVTASMGAGHTAVADELARRLRAAGDEAVVVDLLECAGAAGTRLRRTYRLLLARAPWLYDASMRFWMYAPHAMERLTAAGAAPFESALADAVTEHRPDVVVSCYNLASQCLGRLRAGGRIDTPLVTLVTDPGAHPYWISADVDLHLAYTRDTAARLATLGARTVAWVAPVLRPEFATPPDRAQARAALGLARDARVVVVNAGSWAAGRFRQTLDALAAIPGWQVLALCGRDEGALRYAQGRPAVLAVPWTTELAPYLAAADVLVDNAGGQTCWEALACDVPVVCCHPLPGHGKVNAAELCSLGLIRCVDRVADLRAALASAPAVPLAGIDPFRGEDAATLIRQAARPAATLVGAAAVNRVSR